MGRPVHPYAAIFPLEDGTTLTEMGDDVKANGLRVPIVLYHEQILDGRRRELACERAGVPPTYSTFSGTEDDALAFAVSLNLHRRMLTESQRALVAARLAAARPKGEHVAGVKGPDRVEQAADSLRVSRRTAYTAAHVLKTGDEVLVKLVEDGQMTVSAAAEVADMTPPERQQIVKDVRAGLKPTKAIAKARGFVVKDKTPQPETPDAPPNGHALPRDGRGVPIPKVHRDAFGDSLLPDAILTLKKLLHESRRCASWNPFLRLEGVVVGLEDALAACEAAVPYAGHIKCDWKGCGACRHKGWVPQWRYEEMLERQEWRNKQ
jgi:hypothetical protein